MAWTAKFNRPIELARGKRLTTLAEARDYVLALPKPDQSKSHWEAAAGALMLEGQQPGNHTMFSEIAMRTALAGGKKDEPRPAKATRKTRMIS